MQVGEENWSLVGPNGAGKTTTLRVIGGCFLPGPAAWLSAVNPLGECHTTLWLGLSSSEGGKIFLEWVCLRIWNKHSGSGQAG
jgi:ABC-type molybdenum transport system ATPase subunit/photorepair protein PhrA